MARAARQLVEQTRALKTVRAAENLSAVLGCEVFPALYPGTVEARGLPGVYVLIGTPEEVAAEGRRVLPAQWLRVLGPEAGAAAAHDLRRRFAASADGPRPVGPGSSAGRQP